MGMAIEFYEYIAPFCGSCRWMLEKGGFSRLAIILLSVA
jgi:hypothetical protein